MEKFELTVYQPKQPNWFKRLERIEEDIKSGRAKR